MKTVDLGTISYRTPRKRTAKKSSRRAFLFLVCLAGLAAFLFFFSPLTLLRGLLKPVSVFSQVIRGSGIKSSDGRTNILLLGLDRRGNGGGLTDTILLISADLRQKDTVFISLPRDLWVKPLNGKINSAYALGDASLAKGTVEKILSLPVHYYAIVDFESFKKVIDLLGGLEVEVERTFDDNFYPLPGRENDLCGKKAAEDFESEASESSQFNFPCRFEHIHFDKGVQSMDGETALKFVRSRHAQGEEGSDWARTKRQQKMAAAALKKALSLELLLNPVKAGQILSTFSQLVETDIGPPEVEKILDFGKDKQLGEIRAAALDGNFLFTPSDLSLYDGQWVLIPKAGDFSQVQAFVQRLLFGEH